MKKRKLPGVNFSLKTKKTEPPAIMEWINAQTNLMDSFRYLIENDIRAHGIRNLQQVVPADRGPLWVEGAGLAGVTVAKEEAAAGQAEAATATEAADEPAAAVEPDEEIDEEDIDSWL